MSYLLFIEGTQGLQTLQRLLDHARDVAVVVPQGFDNSAIQSACRTHGLEVLVRERGVPLDLSDREFKVLVSSQFQFRIDPSEYELAQHAVNIHASILPTYKGKHSDVWALINDERILGITVHRLNPGFDDGEIMLVEQVAIDDSLTHEEIYDRIAARLPGIVDQIADGSIFAKRDRTVRPDVYWRVRKPIDSQISWQLAARKVFLFVRALARPPIYAFSGYRRSRYEFRRVVPVDTIVQAIPGSVVELDGHLHIVCGDARLVRVIDVDRRGEPLAPGMVLH